MNEISGNKMANFGIRKVAVVTGASSGIGAATALALASKGYDVIGLARRVERVTELATKAKGGKIHARQCDVSSEEQVISAFKWINGQFGGVDILVNNAGVCMMGGTIGGKFADWKAMMDINVLGLSLCTKEALKTMRNRGDDGAIINVSSIAGQYVSSNYDIGLYTASKHAVTALTKSISNDLAKKGSKIRVTNISPGAVYTEIITRNAAQLKGTPFDPKNFDGNLPPKCLDSQDIADAILYVLSTPGRVQIPELTIQPVGQEHI